MRERFAPQAPHTVPGMTAAPETGGTVGAVGAGGTDGSIHPAGPTPRTAPRGRSGYGRGGVRRRNGCRAAAQGRLVDLAS